MRKSKDFKLPKPLLYTIYLTRRRGFYEPEVGDLIALTDIKPRSIDDLQRPNKSYIIVLVQGVVKKKFLYTLFVLSSKPISRVGRKKDSRSYRRKDVKHFAVYLTNMTTNIRISQALHSELEGGKKTMIEKLLRVDSSVYIKIIFFYLTY